MDYSEKSFEILYKSRYRQMYRMAYSILEDAEDARDVVSQVFTNLWHSKPQINDASIGGYLLTATRNQALHIVRSKALQREMERQLQEDREEAMEAERRELLGQLHHAIEENLTEQDRRILALHYEEDKTYDETAKTLGISYSAVNKHITRSLSRLRKVLKIEG